VSTMMVSPAQRRGISFGESRKRERERRTDLIMGERVVEVERLGRRKKEARNGANKTPPFPPISPPICTSPTNLNAPPSILPSY